ncbi:MAG: iron-sulfur cluster repair di-iron protein [Bacteroidia bacterium]|nr:iron-sulfur cluster repair di-iron protein [Bacteroidia bacterium]
MKNELLTKTLAQIVNANHQAANVFEKYDLDFCCKGKRTLEAACAETKLQTEQIITELEKTGKGNSNAAEIDFNEMPLTQLAEYIVMTHHSYVKNEMPAIMGYLQKVASKHGERHPEMLKVFQLFTAVKEEMEQHMQKEELVLFPRIKEISKQIAEGQEIIIKNTYLLSPINMMEQEHDHAGSMLAEIRKLTNEYTPPKDACTTYRLSFAALKAFELDLHQHVHLENNILFPKALQLFESTHPYSLN